MAAALWIAIYAGVLLWSSIEPYDLLTWLLETLPAMVGAAVLAATYTRFRLTGLTYTLILIHAVILMVGGHYTYAEVPIFDWLGQLFGWQRNNYDKLGHLAQGLVPAIIAREILIRKEVISTPAWRNFFIVCFCLALSAVYELIEWIAALVSQEAAESFLGTQGYVWDTQSDMAWALFGSILALTLLGRVHDRQLGSLSAFPAESQVWCPRNSCTEMNEFIRFDRQSDALTSLRIFSYCMENVIDSNENWKYAIISMHNALQGYMCISLRNGNNFLTWKENHLKKWMASFESGKESPFPQLDFFMELFDKLFAGKHDIERSKISSLNDLRNNLIHFNTDSYSIQVKQAYENCAEALQAVKLTKKFSRGIFFYNDEQNESFNKAVERAENILLKYEQFTTQQKYQPDRVNVGANSREHHT